jgi:hypothetical protein
LRDGRAHGLLILLTLAHEVIPSMKSLRVRLARIAALLVGLTLIWACNAPPIVVPPPSVSFSSELLADAAGNQHKMWRATQAFPLDRAAFATFTLVNLNRGTGILVVADAEGTFVSERMEGSDDDFISLSYQTPDGAYSDSICLLLREGPDIAPFCPP